MKREFSSFVRISPILNRKLGVPVILTTYSDVVFDEEGKNSSQGLLFEQSLKVAIPQSEAYLLPKYPLFYAQVELHDGVEFHVWGNLDYPVKVIVSPQTDTVSLVFSCKSLFPLLRG